MLVISSYTSIPKAALKCAYNSQPSVIFCIKSLLYSVGYKCNRAEALLTYFNHCCNGSLLVELLQRYLNVYSLQIIHFAKAVKQYRTVLQVPKLIPSFSFCRLNLSVLQTCYQYRPIICIIFILKSVQF